jgi:hypothetical protein
MPIKQEVVEQLTGKWQIGLFEAPCKAPHWCLAGCCCCCCMAGKQRGDILEVIGEPYVCCGGMFPCGPLGEPQDQNCMWAEAFCCHSCAISANRFLIQTRFDRENTCCDDCILWTVCLASWAVCILQCVGVDVPQEIENLVDCMIMTVNGCMLAQQQNEIEYVKKTGFGGVNPAIKNMLAPNQQHMISQGKPSIGGGMAMAAGAAVGGGAGGAAAYGAYGGQPQQYGQPQQQVMGQPYGNQYGNQYGGPVQGQVIR